MKGKVIAILIVSIFILSGLTTVSAVQHKSTINPSKKSLMFNSLSTASPNAEFILGKVEIIDGVCNCIVYEDAGGEDNTLYIPHGEDVSLYVEYEIKDCSYIACEYWKFTGRLWPVDKFNSYCQFGGYKEDVPLDDDSTSGFFEIIVDLGAFKNTGCTTRGWIKAKRARVGNPFDIQDFAESGLPGIRLISVNSPPDKPEKPSGDSDIKYPCTKEYSVSVPNDDDGDKIVKYEWKIRVVPARHSGFTNTRKTSENTLEFNFQDFWKSSRELNVNFYIKVRAKEEIYGQWSPWSNELEIKGKKQFLQSKDKTFSNHLENYPGMLSILQFLFS